jgi:hypothetical protein
MLDRSLITKNDILIGPNISPVTHVIQPRALGQIQFDNNSILSK